MPIIISITSFSSLRVWNPGSEKLVAYIHTISRNDNKIKRRCTPKMALTNGNNRTYGQNLFYAMNLETLIMGSIQFECGRFSKFRKRKQHGSKMLKPIFWAILYEMVRWCFSADTISMLQNCIYILRVDFTISVPQLISIFSLAFNVGNVQLAAFTPRST